MLLQAGWCETQGETGEIIREDGRNSKNHLPESQAQLAIMGVWEKQFLGNGIGY